MFDGRCLKFDLSFAVWISHQPSNFKHQTSGKEVTPCRVSKFVN
jgi:hypothetical protein